MEKILVFSTWQLTQPPHFETDLEIMENHLEMGDRVYMIGCNAQMPACDTNIRHDLARCLYCVGRRIKGLKMLPDDIVPLPLFSLTDSDHLTLTSLPSSFKTMDDLRNFRINNHDIGYGALSSLISKLRDPNPDLEKYGPLVSNFLVSSLGVYLSLINHFTTYEIDKVYVFNVRFAITRAVFRACEYKKVRCITHDRGHNIHHYNLVVNTMLHDIANIRESISRAWESQTDTRKRSELASQWFLDRAGGKEQSWKSFVADQDSSQLPADWDPNKINIVIFNSSDDEFAAIGREWDHLLYKEQMEGISKIIETLSGRDNIRLYLRVHPNLMGVQNEQTTAIKKLYSPNLTVIPADSPISTYQLVKNASKVVTFGSTVGIEAVYWGIPSILAGQSFYRDLGGTYNPDSHEKLIGLLLDEKLEPGDREAAMKYGYYFNTFGIPFRYYKAQGISKGLYKGRRITPGYRYWAQIAGLMALPPLRRILNRRSTKHNLAVLKGEIV